MRTRLIGLGVACVTLALATAAGCGAADERSDFVPPDGGEPSSSSSSGQQGGSSSGGISNTSSGGHDGGSSGNTCATAESIAERQPVYLDIVLDGSGSMDAEVANPSSASDPRCAPGTFEETCGFFGCQRKCRDVSYTENDPAAPGRYTGKKWIAARDALKAYFDAQAVAASPILGVGMFVFSSTHLQETPPRNTQPVNVLDAAHSTALWDLIRPNTWPLGRTPIRASIDRQANYLRSFNGQAPLAADGRRVILLITDGVPLANSDFDLSSETKDTVKAAVQAALDGTPRVETAVIGVGDPSEDVQRFDETFLSQLAQLGGLAPAGCKANWQGGDAETPCHLQVTPGAKTAQQIKDEMVAAINAIAGSVASCSLTLAQSSEIDPTKVNVVYVDSAGNETQVPQDASNGWSYDDPEAPTQVLLHGQACDRLQNDNGRVTIVVGCPTGTIVR